MSDTNTGAGKGSGTGFSEPSAAIDSVVMELARNMTTIARSAGREGVSEAELVSRFSEYGDVRVQAAIGYLACVDVIVEKDLKGVNTIYFKEYAGNAEKPKGKK